LGYIGIKKFH